MRTTLLTHLSAVADPRSARLVPVALAAAPLSPLKAWSAWHAHLTTGRGVRRETLRLYRFVLLDFFAYLTPTPWQRAGPVHLDRWLDHRRTGPHGAPYVLSQASRRTYAKAVRGFYRFAAAEGLVDSDAFAAYELPPEPVPSGLSLDTDELAELFVHLATDARVRTMAALAFWQFLRAAEVAHLMVEDLDLSRGEERILVRAKGGRDEWRELNRKAVPLLRAWIGARRSGPLFESLREPGRGISPDRVSRLLSDAVKGVNDAASGHALRHAAARAMRRAHVDVDTIAAAGGWASRDTLIRYYLAGLREDVAAAFETMPDPTKRRPAPSNQRRAKQDRQ